MANTYTLISSVTVGAGGASSIEFTSIPATYTDLLVKGSLRADKTSGNDSMDLILAINTSTANQSTKVLRGTGSGVNSYTITDRLLHLINPSDFTASTFSNFEIYFPNYASSNNKSFSVDSVTENNSTTAYSSLIAGLWSQTAAITGLKFTVNGASSPLFVQYSTAYLYGISNS